MKAALLGRLAQEVSSACGQNVEETSFLGHLGAQQSTATKEPRLHLWKMGLPDPLQEPKNS